jgi:hypothetical protein
MYGFQKENWAGQWPKVTNEHFTKKGIFTNPPLYSKMTAEMITTNDLLHMNSGLEWEENYSTICDATKMLYVWRHV